MKTVVKAKRPMKHSIRLLDQNTAIALGINEALFLNRLNFWIEQGYGELYKGKRYIYNTFEQWSENELPLTPRQIQKAVYNLRDRGIVLIEKLKQHQWRQTNYYSIDYQKWRESLVNSSSPFSENEFTNQGNDLYTERTDQKEHSKREQDNKSQKKSDIDSEEEELPTANSDPEADLEPETEEKADRQKSKIRRFHSYLIKELSKLDWIRNAKGYAQKVVTNLLNGSPSSQKLYDQWKDEGRCDLSLTENNAPDLPKNRPQKEPTEKVELPSGFKEWLIGQLQMPNETRASAIYRANKIINSDQLSEFLNEFNVINDEARSRYEDQEDKRNNPESKSPAVNPEPEEEELLDAVTNAKNAIKLILKFPHHHIGNHLLEMAKNQANEDELLEINQIETEAGIYNSV